MNRLPVALAIVASTSAHLAAQDLAFSVNQGASSVSATFSLLADASGSLIGDYDETTNPEGTQTRPGFFGGSGNNPIPVQLDLLSSTEVSTTPAGDFDAALDTNALTLDITNLNLDLIAAGSATSGIDVTLEWDLFHTVNPTFVFPGGIPLTLPLSNSQITTLTLTQTGPSALPGLLTPDGPDTYTIALALPVSVTIAADSATLPIPETTFDAILPLAGSLTLNPDNSASIALSIDLGDLSQTIDLSAAPAAEDIPFDLPTFGEQTASVLLTLMFSDATIASSGSINIVAEGASAACNAADLAKPYGALDFSDVVTFLTLFSEAAPGADLAAPNGVFDFSDVVAFLSAFAAGCP
ncbi:MAG: GC-type dockerin domain-anchored protein [Phycisphaerales bacterium JB059]